MQEPTVLMNAHHPIKNTTHQLVSQEAVRDRGGGASQFPDRIRHRQQAISPPNTAFSSQTLLPDHHQMGKIDLIVMGWSIWAMVEAELAVVAFVDDLMMIAGGQLGDIAFIDINSIQQGIERGAQIEAASAPIADLVDPQGFFLQLLGVDRLDETETFHHSPIPRTISGQPSPTNSRHVAEN
jgi:hypothetical protein